MLEDCIIFSKILMSSQKISCNNMIDNDFCQMLYNQSVHKISTAEGITFPIPLAGPVNRFLAFLIDFFVILVINKIAHSIFSLFFMMSADVANAFLIIGYFVIQ